MPQRLTNHLFRLHSDFFSCAAVVQKALFIYMTLNSLFCRGSRNVFPTPPFLVAAVPGRRVSWLPRFLVAAFPESRGQAPSLHVGDVETGLAPVSTRRGCRDGACPRLSTRRGCRDGACPRLSLPPPSTLARLHTFRLSYHALLRICVFSSSLFRALVERQGNNLRRHALAPNIDLHVPPGRGASSVDVAHTDTLLQRRAAGAAGQLANALIAFIDGIATAWHAAFAQFDADEQLARPLLFYLAQRIAPDEISLSQLHRPAQTCLQRIGPLIKLVAVETVAGLQTQRVARAQPRRQQSPRLAGGEQVVPEPRCIDGSAIEFKAIFAGIAGARDDAVHAVDLSRRTVIIANAREIERGKLLQDALRLRPLEGEQRSGIGLVGDGHIAKMPRLSLHPGEVFGDVAGVDNKHIVPLGQIEDQ